MKKIFLLACVLSIISLSAFVQLGTTWTSKTSVFSVLFTLGEEKPIHYIETWNAEKSKIGEELFFNGKSKTIEKKKSKRISKHYTCNNCHNSVKEDPNLANPTAENRLQLATETGVPFLQGTTMYGVVNRESWYNGDYEKKYGSLVIPAQDTLANAIQLCAQVCSQGRLLEPWELEAFLHYFWSLQLTLGDLNLSKEEWVTIQQKETSSSDIIHSKFLAASAATFIPALAPDERTYGENGNIENGKTIYNQSCLHCHHPKQRITNLKLEDNRLSHQLLKSMLKKSSNMSVYEIVRHGTYPIAGYKPYMPHYTEERLTNQQIEDLVAYISNKSN